MSSGKWGVIAFELKYKPDRQLKLRLKSVELSSESIPSGRRASNLLPS
jgi:hypothetical protein